MGAFQRQILIVQVTKKCIYIYIHVPHVWDIWGGFLSLTSILDISTALMRPRRPKQYCLQLVIYIYIYIYIDIIFTKQIAPSFCIVRPLIDDKMTS